MNARRQRGIATASQSNRGSRGGRNSLRVIAGRWRGRKFSFPDGEALRPSPDRIRETLFNWLRADIAGARCLDPFSGSGALSLESLSRGALAVYSWDQSPTAVQFLQQHQQQIANQLNSDQSWTIQRSNSLTLLNSARPAQLPAFDVVFLDPPFRQGLLPQICAQLEQNNWLTASAKIYIEQERDHPTWELPSGWQAIKHASAGQVSCLLAAREPTYEHRIKQQQ